MCVITHIHFIRGCFDGWQNAPADQIGKRCVDVRADNRTSYKGCPCPYEYVVSHWVHCNDERSCRACCELETYVKGLNHAANSDGTLNPGFYNNLVQEIEDVLGMRLGDIQRYNPGQEMNSSFEEESTWTENLDKFIKHVERVEQDERHRNIMDHGYMGACGPEPSGRPKRE